MSDAPSPDDLGERVAHLEGVVETEDRSVERGMEALKHGQMLIVGLCAITIAASVAILVYLLNRLDTLELMLPAHR